jgi:dienelactone hydrolase
MTAPSLPRAPTAALSTFARERFAHGEIAHDVYRKGKGPAVLILTEIPGISPYVLGFADHVVAIGCTAVLPDLFGTAGRDPWGGGAAASLTYNLTAVARVCVAREFNVFAAGRSSPVIDFLRALGRQEHARSGGPGIGVVGMCFTGGFGLALAADAHVLAPVLSQPSLPVGLGSSQQHGIDSSEAQLDAVAERCARTGLEILGLRFKGDPLVPAQRFAFLRQRFGDAFIAIELEQRHGHPAAPLPRHHSVLTTDLIDAPGEPTRAARDRVLAMLRAKLLSGS